MEILRPLKLTGAKSEPVATKTRASVQRIKSSAFASELDVGLERGKMVGRGTLCAISRTTASVNAPPAVERPMRIAASIFPMQLQACRRSVSTLQCDQVKVGKTGLRWYLAGRASKYGAPSHHFFAGRPPTPGRVVPQESQREAVIARPIQARCVPLW